MSYKKMVSFRIDETLIKRMDEMVSFYEYPSRNSLLESMIENTYETYNKDKDGFKTIEDKINELYSRVQTIEDKQSIHHQPDEIQQIIIQLKSKDTPSLDIVNELNSKGYTTLTGKEINRNWVDKQVHSLRKKGLISWFPQIWTFLFQ